MSDNNPVQRAFELAREGDCENIQQLEQKLKREGYSAVLAHLNSPSLRKQLLGLAQEAYAAKTEKPVPHQPSGDE